MLQNIIIFSFYFSCTYLDFVRLEREIFAGDINGALKPIIKRVRFFSVALIYFMLSFFRLTILITFSLTIKYDSQ